MDARQTRKFRNTKATPFSVVDKRGVVPRSFCFCRQAKISHFLLSIIFYLLSIPAYTRPTYLVYHFYYVLFNHDYAKIMNINVVRSANRRNLRAVLKNSHRKKTAGDKEIRTPSEATFQKALQQSPIVIWSTSWRRFSASCPKSGSEKGSTSGTPIQQHEGKGRDRKEIVKAAGSIS